MTPVVLKNYPVPMRSIAIGDRYAPSRKPDELSETFGPAAASMAAAVGELMTLK